MRHDVRRPNRSRDWEGGPSARLLHKNAHRGQAITAPAQGRLAEQTTTAPAQGRPAEQTTTAPWCKLVDNFKPFLTLSERPLNF